MSFGQPRGVLRPTGLRPKFLDRLADRGVDVPMGIFQQQGYRG